MTALTQAVRVNSTPSSPAAVNGNATPHYTEAQVDYEARDDSKPVDPTALAVPGCVYIAPVSFYADDGFHTE